MTKSDSDGFADELWVAVLWGVIAGTTAAEGAPVAGADDVPETVEEGLATDDFRDDDTEADEVGDEVPDDDPVALCPPRPEDCVVESA